jgi:hypothetical protein
MARALVDNGPQINLKAGGQLPPSSVSVRRFGRDVQRANFRLAGCVAWKMVGVPAPFSTAAMR